MHFETKTLFVYCGSTGKRKILREKWSMLCAQNGEVRGGGMGFMDLRFFVQLS